jgi:hypothetical protein
MQITKDQDKAAIEIVELIAETFGNKREIHPATAIASCARLSGSFLFRSFNFPDKNISPGTAVLSEIANDKGPDLINILAWALSTHGIDVNSLALNSTSNAESNFSFLDTISLLQDKAAGIMENNKLNYEQIAQSCAMATAFIINECKSQLAVESGFNTAMYSFIEGAKTFPPEMTNRQKSKKSFFKFWK